MFKYCFSIARDFSSKNEKSPIKSSFIKFLSHEIEYLLYYTKRAVCEKSDYEE